MYGSTKILSGNSPQVGMLVQHSKIGKVLILGCTIFGLFLLGSLIGIRIYRIESAERVLHRLNANYAWTHESPARRATHGNSNRFLAGSVQNKLVAWVGRSIVSDISQITIASGNPSDSQLRFLRGMKQLQSLEIQSHRATDATLSLISRLPKLRVLTLVGSNFSVLGLLQLREAQNLEELRIDPTQFSAIELAVIKAELPGVEMRSVSESQQSPARHPTPNLGVAA